MKKLLKSEVCESREQCTGPTDVHCTREKCPTTVAKKKKKKKTLKSENANAQT